jgi:eukaryotic-like serine/threonine-protein kinase
MLQSGAIIRNRYRIIKLLGSGGFGETYLAEDLDIPTDPKPTCVVKHLRPQSNNPAVIQIAESLFNREAGILYRLSNLHNQIPKLQAHFEEEKEFYLVQEFVDGADLSKEIYPGKRLEENSTRELIENILIVLAAVHEQNIIHRDIKPANIMRRRADGEIVLIDFGAVKEIMTVNASGKTDLTVTIGTAGYMPNEQAAGQPKLCSDIYAVGMMGIYALTGIQPHELPKDPTTGEIIWRNWANVSDEFANILNKMAQYHFSQRYHNATEALEALAEIKPKLPEKTKQQIQFKPRRQILNNLGWVGVGFILSIITGRLLEVSSNQQQLPSLQSQPKASPASRLTPEAQPKTKGAK